MMTQLRDQIETWSKGELLSTGFYARPDRKIISELTDFIVIETKNIFRMRYLTGTVTSYLMLGSQ